MRQQLIEWLVDDLAPRVRKSGKAEDELLKFASEKNLSPALLEALGQLFNTAKTLSFLEKSSTDRGAEFPIVDVQKVVGQYLEVPAKKMAHDPDGWLSADTDLAPRQGGMPDFFSMPETSGLEFEMPKAASASPAEKLAYSDLRSMRANLDTLNQIRFDIGESARNVLEGFAKQARQSGILFDEIECDAQALFGDAAKPAMDKIADYLTSAHIQIKRGTWDGTPRLVEHDISDIEYFIGALDQLKEANVMIAEVETQIKEATAQLIPFPGEQLPKAEDRGQGASDQNSGAPARVSPGPSDDESWFERGSVSGSPFTTVPDALFDVLKGPRDKVLSHAGDFFDSGSSGKVESALDDAAHLALLQNLMTTDEVLAEADPDAVVSAFNTIRQTAPQLAKDINTMRVALRSAVQHEGIDPFTIKGLAETEMARQKATQSQAPRKQHSEKE